MRKDILLVFLSNRVETAVKFQQILTENGCIVKTRLGLHEGTEKECKNYGLVFLELMGSIEDNEKLANQLKTVPNLKVEHVVMELD
jgi:hypothetical protein